MEAHVPTLVPEEQVLQILAQEEKVLAALVQDLEVVVLVLGPRDQGQNARHPLLLALGFWADEWSQMRRRSCLQMLRDHCEVASGYPWMPHQRLVRPQIAHCPLVELELAHAHELEFSTNEH